MLVVFPKQVIILPYSPFIRDQNPTICSFLRFLSMKSLVDYYKGLDKFSHPGFLVHLFCSYCFCLCRSVFDVVVADDVFFVVVDST